MELKKYMALIGSILLLSLIMVTDSYATNDDSGISQGDRQVGFSESGKQRYVDLLRKFEKNRLANTEDAIGAGLDLPNEGRQIRQSNNEHYIVNGLYRVKIGLINDKNFPRSPHKFNPKYPAIGGLDQDGIDSFFSQHYKDVMEEYFTEDYLTFYQIKILEISESYVSIEALIRNAAEFKLLLKDSRVVYLDSIVSPPPLEIIEDY